jgi:hypothetical protein
MLRRDYLERLIEQFAAVIAQVTARVKEGQAADGVREADKAIASLASMPWPMLARLEAGTVFTLLDRERVRVLVDVLAARAVAARAAGDASGAARAASLASDLRAKLGEDAH